MNRNDVFPLYTEALRAEREASIYQQALKKVRHVLRSMPEEKREEYLQGQSFSSMVYQMQRKDKVYQALLRGELVWERDQSEWEDLSDLILREAEAGNAVSLPFLRSVKRSRVTLAMAHEAVQLTASKAIRNYFNTERKAHVDIADERVARYLRSADIPIPGSKRVEFIVPHLMDTTFRKGITTPVINQAFQPQSLQPVLQQGLLRTYPALRKCGSVVLPSGETVNSRVKTELIQARQIICRETNKRYTPERIQQLLTGNPFLRERQERADADFAKERGLRNALLNAIPEHYRDLYPLARQMRRHFILHLGPTNSGKTYEGVDRLRGAARGIYLGPLRLLAAEQFETLNLNDVPCSLVTGEEQIRVPGSRVQSSTVEMADLKTHYDVAVIDECQMIADRNRGGAWTAAILGLCADEIHACASPDAEQLLTRMIQDCGDELTIVRHERMTPLEMEKQGFQFPASVRPGDALIVFSKARVHAVAAELRGRGYRVSLIYGALPPDVRRDQADRFQRGETEIVVSTDAIAMGMNLPIQRVVFLESEKYDGDIVRPLTDSEIKQIAGRAGRYGIYDVGYVNAFGFQGMVSRALAKPLVPLTEAIIRFPESLLGIPLPLTEILNQWISMQEKGFFSKATTARMEQLAKMMETPTTDKELLYRFLCVPFDETEPELLARWKAMYQAECQQKHIDVLAEIPGIVNPEDCTVQMLDALEADYRCCDLYYNYARLFLEDSDRILEEIQRRKNLLSLGIIHILSTQKLQQKTCASCHKKLPWNWPFRLCDSCHRQQNGYQGPKFSSKTAKRKQSSHFHG